MTTGELPDLVAGGGLRESMTRARLREGKPEEAEESCGIWEFGAGNRDENRLARS